MEEGLNRFGEEVRVLRSKRILRTQDDYVKAFGLNVNGCKVFPNPEEEGIYIKCPINGGEFQVYKAILIDERTFDGLYVFYPSWVDYRPFVERWKKKHHWRTMTQSEVLEARKKVRMESIDDSEQRAFFVFCCVLYAIALLVSPALIVTAFGGRLRKLTPLECMRLMGFSDKDEQAMRSIGMSDSAIYHCAGDSIVVDVLMDIFKELL